MRRPGAASFSIERVYSDVRAEMPSDIAVHTIISDHSSKGIIPRLRAAWGARRHATSVNHITGDVHFLTYFLGKRRTILTIHDCVLIERVRGLRRFLLWLFWFWLPEKRCVRIVAISHETKRRILSHLRCDPEKIVVIHDPVSSEFHPAKRTFQMERPRILHLGTKANKNLERLIAAISGLEVTLVVIGRLSFEQSRLISAAQIACENHVGLTDEALRTEYAAADIVAFVSTDEGFGLPVLEAQAVGRPVVTSRRPPMDEVAGGGAVLVDPFEISSIRDGIQQLIEDEALREKVVAEGFRNVERFRSRVVAEAYARLYRAVASEA